MVLYFFSRSFLFLTCCLEERLILDPVVNSTRNMSDSEFSLTQLFSLILQLPHRSQSLNSNFPVSFLHILYVIDVVAHPVEISLFEFVQGTFMLNHLAHRILIIKISSLSSRNKRHNLSAVVNSTSPIIKSHLPKNLHSSYDNTVLQFPIQNTIYTVY